MGPLCIDTPAMGSVATADDLVDKSAVRTEIVEFLGAPHQQGIVNSVFEMTMRAFDRAVLMRDTFVVARRGHPIMGAKLIVTVCEIDPGVGIEVAECRRQAVAAMIKRRTTHGPQGILKSFGQRDEAFPAENDMGVFEARPDEPKVIEQMIKRLAGDRYTKAAGVGKIRKAQSAWLVRLTEDDLLRFAIDSTPRPDASFKRTADTFR
nr:hypothetical protein RP007_04297 [Rhizobium sp. P007]